MPIDILMPALSPTMTEGRIAAWLKAPGDHVRPGDVLAEIETDKASMEFEAADDGVLDRILVPAGTEGIAVNTPIATLRAEGETTAAPAPAAAPAAVPPEPRPVAAAPAARLAASPLARRMAEQAGLDLGRITGTGPQGRVVKADIEALMPRPAAAPVVASQPTVRPAGPGARELADLLQMPYRLEPLSGMRKTIARRLTESKQTVPHFYLTVDVAVDALLALRTRLNQAGGIRLSVNDFVIRAAALALKKVTAANASYDEAGIVQYERADISVAVATPAGLITPIVRGADVRGLADISATMKDLAARARDGKLRPEEYQGGTFSISNLGMFGVRQFEAVINPPQGCILAVGASEQRAVVRDNALTVATMMSCTLSVDHRVVDGAVGAQWLQAFKGLIEAPETMLL